MENQPKNIDQLEKELAELQDKFAKLEEKHRRAIDALKYHKETFRSVSESVPAVISRFDKTLRYVYVNKELEEYSGITAEEFLGKTNSELPMPEQFTAFWNKHLAIVLETEKEKIIEFDLETENGDIYFQTHLIPEFSPDGTLETIFCISVDISKQKKAEDALRNSESRYRQLVENINEVFFLRDAGENKIIYVSPQIEKIWGWKAENLPSDFYEFVKETVHPEDQQYLIQSYELHDAGIFSDMKFRIVRPDGKIRRILARRFPIYDKDGEIIRVVGLAQDITEQQSAKEKLKKAYAEMENRVEERTADLLELNRKLTAEIGERKRAETKLRESNEKFLQLAHNINEVFWLREEKKFLYVSPAYEKIWGRSCESLYQNPSSNFEAMHPEDRKNLLAKYDWNRFTKDEDFSEIFRIIRPDGSIRWIHSRSFPIKDENGIVIKRAGIAEDITERKQTEEELRKSEAKYRSLFEHASTAMWEHDRSDVKQYVDQLKASGVDDLKSYFRDHPDDVLQCVYKTKVVDVNKAALELYHAKNKAELLNNLDKLSDEGSLEGYIDGLIAMAAGKRRHQYETVNKTLDGDILDIIIRTSVAPGSEENWKKVLVSIMDISERKKSEEMVKKTAKELEERNKELDAFAETVAHDLKNPLAVISGYISVLKKKPIKMTPEKSQSYLDRIEENAYKMESIIRELLLFARLRKQEISVEPLYMDWIVKEAIKILQYFIRKNDAAIILPKTWHNARGYPYWVEEVWVNYISNAIKYGGRSPTIELGSERQSDGNIRFWVRDYGSGISEENQAKLFNPFMRLDSFQVQGHGLGLSTVRKIIEKLGGTVGVDSEIGEGSTFYFTLPEI